MSACKFLCHFNIFAGAHRSRFQFLLVMSSCISVMSACALGFTCWHDFRWNGGPFGLVDISCQEMSAGNEKLSDLWRALRAARSQHVAVDLIRLGIRSVDDLVRESALLIDKGIPERDIQEILQKCRPEPRRTSTARSDLPPVQDISRRASFTLALRAAQPNNHKRSLEELDRDVVARSSAPSHDSRLRTFRALAAAWEVQPFPLSVESIRCVAASLKAGGYRSAQLYFQSAINFQLRVLHEMVHPLLRSLIKDMVRSIKRGLGPASLKHGFDPFLVTGLIDPNDSDPFDFTRLSHFVDVVVICIWFMLREIEVAAACQHHLFHEGPELHLVIPTHKTSTEGSYTTRILRCGCHAVAQRLCPWHSAERHLIRLSGHHCSRAGTSLPLVPDSEGKVLSKNKFIETLRTVLAAAGIPVVYKDADDREVHRFGGHCLRVSGAMMLAAAGTPVSLIQLLGRWSSSAIERYIQQAPLSVVPSLPSRILGRPSEPGMGLAPVVPPAATPSPSTPASAAMASGVPVVAQGDGSQNKKVQALVTQLHALEAEVSVLKSLISKPDVSMVVRKKSDIVHITMVNEMENEPIIWQTKCGWYYGTRSFYRVPRITGDLRKCLKCFQLDQDQSSAPDGGPEESGSDSSDSSSSESEQEAPIDELPEGGV